MIIGHIAVISPFLMDKLKKEEQDPDSMEEFEGDNWIESYGEAPVVEETFVW